jgi:hypothetical protein
MHLITFLRQYATLLVLTLSALTLHAQNISLKGDVITVDKKPYAKLKKSGSMLQRDYTLTTLDDKDIMLAKSVFVSLPSNERFVYYSLTFRPGGEVAEMDSPGLSVSQRLIEAIVQQGVMRDGQPDPEGIARFVKAYPTKFSEKYAKDKADQLNAPPLSYQVVERSRRAPFSISGSRIIQDGKAIGTISTTKPDGDVIDQIQLPDGTVIAVVKIAEWSGSSGTMSYKILAKRNNVYHDRTANGGVVACRQDAVQWLIGEGLL